MYTKKIRCGGSTWVGKRSLRGLRSREAEDGEQGGAAATPSENMGEQTYLFFLPKILRSPAREPFGKSPMFLEVLRLSPRTPI